jgi:putative methionine-R-sulfoxide reductase with GAF domain
LDKNNRTARERNVLNILEQSKPQSLVMLLDEVTSALHENFPHYTGVYLYLLKGDMLVLGPYRGRPTEHAIIPIGTGICGRAARVKQTVMVDDVALDAEYIACSLETRSEIVVPIMQGEHVLGEIDIDSDVSAAFTDQDWRFLEDVAERLARKFI